MVANIKTAIQLTWNKMFPSKSIINTVLNATQAAWVLALLHHCIAEEKANAHLTFNTGTCIRKFAVFQEFCIDYLEYAKQHFCVTTDKDALGREDIAVPTPARRAAEASL